MSERELGAERIVAPRIGKWLSLEQSSESLGGEEVNDSARRAEVV